MKPSKLVVVCGTAAPLRGLVVFTTITCILSCNSIFGFDERPGLDPDASPSASSSGSASSTTSSSSGDGSTDSIVVSVEPIAIALQAGGPAGSFTTHATRNGAPIDATVTVIGAPPDITIDAPSSPPPAPTPSKVTVTAGATTTPGVIPLIVRFAIDDRAREANITLKVSRIYREAAEVSFVASGMFRFSAWGGGGGGSGGAGGFADAVVTLDKESIKLTVGSGGGDAPGPFGGGGLHGSLTGFAAFSGGGFSAVSRGALSPATAILIAGGGGGGAVNSTGGAGGGVTGEGGTPGGLGGGGGTATAGGPLGGGNASTGTSLKGGNGGTQNVPGGGGGGGLFGGGGGGPTSGSFPAGSGGGGSGFTTNGSTMAGAGATAGNAAHAARGSCGNAATAGCILVEPL